jgi:hypothetical protein
VTITEGLQTIGVHIDEAFGTEYCPLNDVDEFVKVKALVAREALLNVLRYAIPS